MIIQANIYLCKNDKGYYLVEAESIEAARQGHTVIRLATRNDLAGVNHNKLELIGD